MRTLDFLRTTSLTSAELITGMLFGSPLMAWFIAACSMPISLVIGLLAHYTPEQLAQAYFVMAVTGVFACIAGLLCSMLTARGGIIVLLLMWLGPWSWGIGFTQSTFPGFAALSPCFRYR